jgi:hypothetical protein
VALGEVNFGITVTGITGVHSPNNTVIKEHFKKEKKTRIYQNIPKLCLHNLPKYTKINKKKYQTIPGIFLVYIYIIFPLGIV